MLLYVFVRSLILSQDAMELERQLLLNQLSLFVSTILDEHLV